MSKRVEVETEEVELENEAGILVWGITARCTECDHETESFGTSDRSVGRCLALMRDECPLSQDNYYVAS